MRKARYSIRMWKGLYGDNAAVVSDHIENYALRAKSMMAAGYILESKFWPTGRQAPTLTNEQCLKYFPLAIQEGLSKGFYMDEYKFAFDYPEGIAYDRPDKLTKYYSFFATNAPVSGFTGAVPYPGGDETSLIYSGPVELRGLEPEKTYFVTDYGDGTNVFDNPLIADSNGMITINVDFTECVLLKAELEAYDVVFDSNGGSAVASQRVIAGDMIKKPANPTRSGYVFQDWYSDNEFVNAWDFNTTVTENVTLYAKWLKSGGPGGSNGSVGAGDTSEVTPPKEDTAAPKLEPMKPMYPAGTVVDAIETNNPLILNGEAVDFPAVKIDGWNWLKLRDMAELLNGTSKQFSVIYDSVTKIIDIRTGNAYESIGDELIDMLTGDFTAMASLQQIRFNGQIVNVAAYNIDGYNYFRLRDLMILLDISVVYNQADGTITLDLGKPYTE